MTLNEGNSVTLGFATADPDVPAQNLTFSLDPGFPEGASINSVNGLFTWTPNELQGPGVYPITVVVTDNGTPPLSATNTFTITVNEVNSAPVLASVGNRSVNEGSALNFVVSASDPNDIPPNNVTLSLDGKPPGASFDAVTGAFSWTPDETQGPGAYPVTFTVTDDGVPPMHASETITITVNKTTPLRIENLSVSVSDGGFSFSWSTRAGKTYKVQYKSSLTDPAWRDLPMTPIISGSTASITDKYGASRERYYRVVEVE
ncbi:MAG: putative Ig domain-containing protein [Verrucomicrobia bacterium]|nr:putative Ig domain-containing protein [Verrucomicrobiota bacterium]